MSPRARVQSRPVIAALALVAWLMTLGYSDPARALDLRPAVIVLSWDGVRHDAIDDPSLPALGRMRHEGAHAEALVPVFPSMTFPNHVSLATGAPPSVHGIVANRFWDRARGEFDYSGDASWIEAEPLWIAAERQGVRAATFFWVGSESDWHRQRASFRRAPFSSKIGEAEKVDQIIDWLSLPPGERPQLIMSWWHGADHAGHAGGPYAPDVAASLRKQDAQLSRLHRFLDESGAWATTTLIIVSDHGMAAVSESIDPRGLLRDAGIDARVFNSSALSHILLDDLRTRTRALELFNALPQLEAFAGDALPAHLDYRFEKRTGDIVVLSRPPTTLSARGSKRGIAFRVLRAFGKTQGAHGYDPARFTSMHGIFVALGRGVEQGRRLGRVHALQLAPTVAALLGIDAPASATKAPIALAAERRPAD